MVEIKRIGPADARRALATINRLLPQLSPSGKAVPLTIEELNECLGNQNFYLFVARETSGGGEQLLLGMGSIFFQRNLGRWIAEIHDIVVDKDHRGQGIGEIIVRHLIENARGFAREHRLPVKLYYDHLFLGLTSRPSRVEANKLYLKLGFVQVAEAKGEWGTNLYKMMIRPEE
ncbi:MAG: GNAT family N-acetyltransferase [Candidatus Sungiibacteriota bacterium]|uniref:GNAT family N-acetyltransferase n=1 Tax=Candidatus Sungiibacteriota bacterium TaxID=2750080 RepID=A0A7T5UPL1_9BACT|nr:MAG: GNAT family N-acetyltransferase [Candidatus Sungbacteria bacterium]